MANIKQIAQAAGVSIATVSRVVNASGYVSPSTRARVEAAIEDVDYRPNVMASSLRLQASKIIGILHADHRTHFNSSFSDAVEAKLYDSGYVTITVNTQGEFGELEKQVNHLLDMRVAGLLIRPTPQAREFTDVRSYLSNLNVPVVYIESFPNDPESFHVQTNNSMGAAQATRHLIDLGHRHIGVLVPMNAPHLEGSHEYRLREVQNISRESQQDIQLHIVKQECTNRLEFGNRETRRLLQRMPQTTAIFGLSDMVAAGAMRAIRDLGLSVPSDISIVGYDDSPVASAMHPRMTSVAQPVDTLGAAAASMILERIADPALPPRALTVSTSLMVRGSSGPAPN